MCSNEYILKIYFNEINEKRLVIYFVAFIIERI